MATEEALPTAVEKPVVDSASVGLASEKPEVAVGGKKKKSNPKMKGKNPSKPRSGSAHPTYLDMIGEAITSLKERSGSSQYAIAKFIEEKHKDHLPPNFNKLLLVQLRKFAASGKLTKVKNSYKLPAPLKKLAAPVSGKSKKPAVAPKPKPKSATSAKTNAKLAVKAKAKSVLAAKPNKSAALPKPKAAVKVSKPKPKTVATKSSGRPAKVPKTSANDTPGKKAMVDKKPAVPASKAALPKRTRSGKAAAKAPLKKIMAKKTKK